MKSATFHPSPHQRKLMLTCVVVAWVAITVLFVNGIGTANLQGDITMSALNAAGLVLLGLLIIRFLAVGIDDIFRV
jgi:hypothetical protein